MRLWHETLIPYLPRQQLLGQHRECCALRGKGWGKEHSTVNYVFKYSPYYLYLYHMKIMEEMSHRGYNCDPLWHDKFYRGKQCNPYRHDQLGDFNSSASASELTIYPEHDQTYLDECLSNLEDKGIQLNLNKTKTKHP
ncbi:TIGR02328 family protein [Halobacillus ihumii]|uniref:TIGR02328 family protein n=1 Tax=Halobacillus ihumii TaxID=2686092 RepID=UPI0013D8C5E8|nr:TIGR02328 family protein [Halobacillus ihumii]